ncbi:uncharacterized protein LOC117962451 isoform X2 [Acipenser ruthenus]|uniref:uncharacterized protein LOC117962451 isoform X2 n=1 Tax=Acipenser ruthenus TaxID=7906 RepID=UPI002740F029|nr:uncharacterized protein LOC117962451 isoform X2 [Acipenser ruthenus]
MVDRDHKQKKSVYVQTDEKELNEKKMTLDLDEVWSIKKNIPAFSERHRNKTSAERFSNLPHKVELFSRYGEVRVFKKSVKSIKSSDDIVDNRNHQGHKLNMKSLTSKDKDEESLFDF